LDAREQHKLATSDWNAMTTSYAESSYAAAFKGAAYFLLQAAGYKFPAKHRSSVSWDHQISIIQTENSHLRRTSPGDRGHIKILGSHCTVVI
jgi:hypothetical protein